VAPVPTEAAAAMGGACVVGVSLEYYQWDGALPTNIFQLVTRAVSAAQNHQGAICKSYAAVLIDPQPTTFGWHEFDRAEEAMAAGVTAAERAMPRLRELLDQRPRPTSITSRDSPPTLRPSSRPRKRLNGRAKTQGFQPSFKKARELKDLGCLSLSALHHARRANTRFWFRQRQLPMPESFRAS
jgi:hypothetical protein